MTTEDLLERYFELVDEDLIKAVVPNYKKLYDEFQDL